MDNPFDEMQRAVNRAQDTQRSVDVHVRSMSRLCAGRLKRAHGNTGIYSWEHAALCDLKKELADYDMRTGRWKQ